MTTAANFAIETVKNAKQAMIENGAVDAQMVYAVCNKLSVMLNLPIETVTEIMERA